MQNISSQYNPKKVEQKWYTFWEKNGFFSASPDPAKEPYCIVIPPPNITGILHMGHALNNTIQDILIRYKRMQGYSALWMPGTDHAGIATQNVVEKKLAKEGLKRQDLGREKFLEEVWKWRDEYGSTIVEQLKRLGASCDWRRTRFTMDEKYSNAVKDAFIRLYKKGLIYRGDYIINWCPRCQTALSDEEATHHDVDGNLYYIRYPLGQIDTPLPKAAKRRQGLRQGNDDFIADYIVVATTRPETMLGDTAVAVNPGDKRYKNLIGKTVILPLMQRQIKIIADDLVDLKFGTGAVKVTPAHDPNDYQMGNKHKLEFINIMHPDGTLNSNAGEYAGMDRFEAREVILEDLKQRKLIEKIQPYRHAVGHCYRCHTVVEPYLSKQWFVKMKPLAEPAIRAVNEGKIRFYPQRWKKVYLNWMENIKDWCISRQIWWGHRLPVYYCKNCQAGKSQISNSQPQILNSKPNETVIVSNTKPQSCPVCGSGDIYQDEDVLDTWFSSWLWPFETFTDSVDLKYFYPTSNLVTAQEIIFFWVARMIMAGYEFMGREPFKDVYIHGTVRDDTGKKMSKSLGNIIDPIEIIDEFGADALRFSIISITSVGQDVFLSRERFNLGRNFANKIWNVSRFVLMNISEGADTDLCVLYKSANLSLADRWILSCLYSSLKDINKALDSYNFNEAARALYDFIWHKYCDWYVELAKPILETSLPRQDIRAGRGGQSTETRNTQVILYKVLEKGLRMLCPFMPFISEEIWSLLPHKRPSITQTSWPHVQEDLIDKNIEADMEFLINLIASVRNIRAEMLVPVDKRANIIISTANKKDIKLINENQQYIKILARVDNIETQNFISGQNRPKQSAMAVVGKSEVYVLLAGVIDIDAERARLSGKILEIENILKGLSGRLKNREFLNKAPREIVEKERAKGKQLEEDIEKLRNSLSSL